MTKLSVNLNKFALIRNARGNNVPDVLHMAQRCIKNGAHGITVHPRPDQRHATYNDVFQLKELVQQFPEIELNIEGNPIPKFVEVIKQSKPHQCTLVPDAENQLTSDHGWDLTQPLGNLQEIIEDLKQSGIRVSLFLDPDLHQIDRAKAINTDRIELYTEPYASTYDTASGEKVLQQYRNAAKHAYEIGLGVNAGHDLSLKNLAKLLTTIPEIAEVSIGHALVVEAFDYTLEGTIERYLQILRR